MARVPFVSTSWKEGRIWDLWMIVHFLSGVVIGFANTFLELPTLLLFVITIFGMIIWEIIEIVGNVHETAENRLLDIAFGLGGLYLSSGVILSRVSETTAETLFYASLVLLALFCFFGWRAYRKRVEA